MAQKLLQAVHLLSPTPWHLPPKSLILVFNEAQVGTSTSPWLTLRPLEWKDLSTTYFINILGTNPTYTMTFDKSIPFFCQSKYAPLKIFLLLRSLCMHIFKKEIIYVLRIQVKRNDTSINHVYRIRQNFRPSQHYPLQLS